MISYILRRLLFMIPTLIGMSFLVFLLVASRPGGIGAALEFSSGSAQSSDATSRALRRAYLDDRYGLNEPVHVQYLKWLHRVSPFKLGTRDQFTPTGERIEYPRSIDAPKLWTWFADALPVPSPAAGIEAIDAAENQTHDDKLLKQYRSLKQNYSDGRARYVARTVDFDQALAAYCQAANLDDAVDRKGGIRFARLRNHTPDTSLPEWAAVQSAATNLLSAYQTAITSQDALAEFFDRRVFPEAGIGLSFFSLDWPDLGHSFTRRERVSTLILRALPVTLLLNFIAFPIIYLIAIPSGMLAASKQGTILDVGLGSLFVALWSVPIVWAGVLAVGYMANNDYLGWFPVSGLHDSGHESFTFLPSTDANGTWHRGYMLDTLWHICLPVACLVYGGFAVLSKQTRAAMLDNFNQDYVRTAKAKGLPSRDIMLRHVFRNSLLPLITMFVQVFPLMLGGSVVIEKIFSIDGMGKLILDAIYLNDYEIILANATIIGLINMLALLLADILYAMADPRISYK